MRRSASAPVLVVLLGLPLWSCPRVSSAPQPAPDAARPVDLDVGSSPEPEDAGGGDSSSSSASSPALPSPPEPVVSYPFPAASPPLPSSVRAAVFSFGAEWDGGVAPFIGVRVGPRDARGDVPRDGTQVEIPVDRDGRPAAGVPVIRTYEKEFEVEDPAGVVAAFVEAKFAGGIVARVNGVEWFRSNVDPEGSGEEGEEAPPEDRFWVRAVQRGIYQRSFAGLDPSPLRAGSNRLAVEVHGAAEADADPLFYFDLRLDLFSSHGFVVAPYLTVSSDGAAAVAWETAAPTTGVVRFGAGGEAEQAVASVGGGCATHHEATLPPVSEDVEYGYGVVWSPCAAWASEADREERWAPAGVFRGLPPGGRPMVFFAYGDSRAYPQRHARVVQAMLREAQAGGWPAFVVNTGDLTNIGTDEAEWLGQFFRPLAPLLARVPLAPVFGNHDGQDEDWFLRFRLPGNEAWYSFRAGDAEVFVLDAYARFGPGTPQIRWLEGALEASAAPWKIVAVHLPLRSCMADARRRRTADGLASWLGPILSQRGVRLVLAGHDHLYGRAALDDGLVVVTLGGGGAPTYEAREAREGEVCVSALHFARIEVDGGRLALRVFDVEGGVIDEFELVREPGGSAIDSVRASGGGKGAGEDGGEG